ncbi:Uncharacterized protein APZ42_018966 [Daphnia magna]|uniref:Uncharacterized protein n=1 Tax=Daphnia magna TaxID=35525 RepID=A0A164YYX8_9CRUS|nr:Uncharacterized protein APZ42_018966 [Daphnia magna]
MCGKGLQNVQACNTDFELGASQVGYFKAVITRLFCSFQQQDGINLLIKIKEPKDSLQLVMLV